MRIKTINANKNNGRRRKTIKEELALEIEK